MQVCFVNVNLTFSNGPEYLKFWFNFIQKFFTIYEINFKLCDMKSKTNSMLHNTFIGPYQLLNMFRALLCPSSGACDYTDDLSMWHLTVLMAGCWSGA